MSTSFPPFCLSVADPPSTIHPVFPQLPEMQTCLIRMEQGRFYFKYMSICFWRFPSRFFGLERVRIFPGMVQYKMRFHIHRHGSRYRKPEDHHDWKKSLFPVIVPIHARCFRLPFLTDNSSVRVQGSWPVPHHFPKIRAFVFHQHRLCVSLFWYPSSGIFPQMKRSWPCLVLKRK